MPTQPPERQKRPARRWRHLAVVAVVLIGTVSALFRQAERRVEMATTAVTDDIRSSYTLLARAVAEKDPELFTTIVSSRDARWTAVQQSLLAEGLLFDRHPIGLEAQSAVPQLVAINTSPDLNEAEITVTGQYSSFGRRPVTLQQHLVFRRSQRNWLLSPPRSDFWGPWETEQGRLLTLVFRERDNAIAGRLLEDLDTQLASMCANLADINCHPEMNLMVRLESDPVSLSTTVDSPLGFGGRSGLNLPTPSLVGLPVDEAGYRVLLQSYARSIVAAAIAKAVGWQCCQNTLFYQALLDYQLNELGLQPWPLTASEYETMFVNPVVNIYQMEGYWSAPPGSDDGWRQVYSVVTSILEGNSSLSAATMQRQLAAADDYGNWLRGFGPDLLASSAQQNWLRYAQSRLAPPHVSPPSQDILLVCDSDAGETSSLYRYDEGTEAWRTELEDQFFLSMSTADDRDGVWLLARLKQTRRTRGLIWRAEVAGQLFVEPLTAGLFRVDTAGASLLIYAHEYLEPFAAFQRLETTECGDGGCETAVRTGLPVWSPDGRRALKVGQDGRIWLGDDQGAALQPVGMGTAPFWLDSNSFGFLRPAGEQTQSLAEIAVADVATREAQTWLGLEALAAAVSADIDPGQLTINAVTVSTANPDLLFVAASTFNGENADRSYVFVVNQQSKETRLLTETDYKFGRFSPFASSPDGRWLTLNSFDRHSAFWQLHLYDAVTGQAQTLTSAYPFTIRGTNWSPDGRWLLRIQDGYLHLVAPAQGAHRILDHDYGNCSFAAWAN